MANDREIQSVLLQLMAGDLHGVDLVDGSAGALRRGSCYVVLASMEDAGFIRGRNGDDGRRVYAITATGRLATRTAVAK